MLTLFEYGKWTRTPQAPEIKSLLLEIWNQRLFVDAEAELSEDEKDLKYQPFLKFDGNQIRANNFVGFIQSDEEIIEIYPKVFRHLQDAPEEGLRDKRPLILRHIFYWLSYCRKWQFPFTHAQLDTIESDNLPELIINLIAKQFLKVVTDQPLTLYQPVEEALQAPRGSINFKRYINNGVSYGNFHVIDCDYEPFLFDNKINRIIKYCTRLLITRTKLAENLRLLQEVVFILDEVDDVFCTVHDVESASINSFFTDYVVAMDTCRMILAQQLYSNNSSELSQWCLLFPMEYIFEDFVAGYLDSKFSDRWKVEYQKSNLNLVDSPPVFQMQHDIFLTDKVNPQRKIIIDTKYKLRESNFKDDRKKGVMQSDLYQMVSYALKRGCTELFLVYPNISETIHSEDVFEIVSGFDENDRIKISAIEVPFWSLDDFNGLNQSLFDSLERHLL